MSDRALPLDVRLRSAGLALRADLLTAEVVSALEGDGVQPILLKGPSIARWLYDEVGQRVYADTDVLVAADQLPVAQATLRRLGFRRGQAGWLAKSRSWQRDRDLVDLHTSLAGVQTDDATAWRLLSQDLLDLEVGGRPVRVLGEAARVLHLALHAAQHGAEFSKPAGDLERALPRVEIGQWRAAATLARELLAVPAFVAGLRRVDASELLADLGVDMEASPADAILRHAEAPPGALGISQLAAAGSARARLMVLRRGFAPPPEYMRRTHALARRGVWGLGSAYVLRLVRLAWSLPASLAAWRQAKQAGDGQR